MTLLPDLLCPHLRIFLLTSVGVTVYQLQQQQQHTQQGDSCRMGQQWAQLLTTSADALENGQQLGLGRAGPWSCDIIVPKKMEAQWSIHGMGFGITRDEFATLFSSTGSHDEHNLDAVWRTFHCARNNGPDASARPKPASETDVIDAVGLVVTYYLLSNAPINSKISAVFNFMDFNNRAWISSSELTILLMSLAYTLQDVATNVARRTSAGLPTSAPDTSATDATSTTHDESDAFIELLLTGSGEAQLSTERMDDGDHKVDYVAFFDGMQRVLANHRARNKRDASGLSALTRILNTLDPSNEVCRHEKKKRSGPCRCFVGWRCVFVGLRFRIQGAK